MDKVTKLTPSVKDYIWGGEKLKKYGKKSSGNIAETWELSFHKDGLCTVPEGLPLAEAATEKDLGTNVKGFQFFPLLIKLIDAKYNLSVQVHPSDEYALKNEGQFGKTEMWYVVEAEEGSGLYLGFKKDVTPEQFASAIADNTVTDLLNFVKVNKGDHYFIKSGTVHAIGKGCTICEIQQNSNVTYRVYDYDRRDANGNARPLHVEKAKDVADLQCKKPVSPLIKEGNASIISCSKYFTVRRLSISGETSISTDETSFKAITFVSGEGQIENQAATAGDTFFIPANYGFVKLTGNAEVIISNVEKYVAEVTKENNALRAEISTANGTVIAVGLKRVENENANEEADALINKILSPLGMDKSDLFSIKVNY